MAQNIQLSDHFTYPKLIRFTLPSILMMIFTSIYSVVDGVFVSNFVGKTSFAAVNLMFPFLMMLGVAGFMLGTGGSALVAKMLGESRKEKAKGVFTMLVVVGFAISCLFSIIGVASLRPVAKLMGAEGQLFDDCLLYGRILMISLPFFTLQNIFQPFMVAAERPQLGLIVTIFAGVMNILFDFLLIVVFKMGLSGAAWATVAAETTGGAIPLVYFALPNKSPLRFVKPDFDMAALFQSLFNGLSEFFSSISGTIVSMCYNYQLMKYLGENGVAAYGVIMYVQFIFFAVFLGFAIGSSPIVSYNYGSKNNAELRNVYVKSLKIMAVLGLTLTISMEVFSYPLTKLFVGYDARLHSITLTAFRIYGLSYLLVGLNFYTSSFFTALNNGLVSAVLSTTRALIFETSAIFVIPAIFGVKGIWFAVLCAEAATLILSVYFLNRYKERYGYVVRLQ